MIKCRGCIHYSTYDDGYSTIPVCLRTSDLGAAYKAVKNSVNCKYRITQKQITVSEVIKIIKNNDCKECDEQMHKGCMCRTKQIIRKLKEEYGIEDEKEI